MKFIKNILFLICFMFIITSCSTHKKGDITIYEHIGKYSSGKIYASFKICQDEGGALGDITYLVKDERAFNSYPEATNWLQTEESQNKELISKAKKDYNE